MRTQVNTFEYRYSSTFLLVIKYLITDTRRLVLLVLVAIHSSYQYSSNNICTSTGTRVPVLKYTITTVICDICDTLEITAFTLAYTQPTE